GRSITIPDAMGVAQSRKAAARTDLTALSGRAGGDRRVIRQRQRDIGGTAEIIGSSGAGELDEHQVQHQPNCQKRRQYQASSSAKALEYSWGSFHVGLLKARTFTRLQKLRWL